MDISRRHFGNCSSNSLVYRTFSTIFSVLKLPLFQNDEEFPAGSVREGNKRKNKESKRYQKYGSVHPSPGKIMREVFRRTCRHIPPLVIILSIGRTSFVPTVKRERRVKERKKREKERKGKERKKEDQHGNRNIHNTSPYLTTPHHHTTPHLTSPHLTSPHLTSPHLTSPHLTSPHLTSTSLSFITSLYLVIQRLIQQQSTQANLT